MIKRGTVTVYTLIFSSLQQFTLPNMMDFLSVSFVP